jgi:hypothetical protein
VGFCRTPDAPYAHVLSSRKQPLSSEPISSALVYNSLVLLASQVNTLKPHPNTPYALPL